ncbi:hypothetical protein SLS60_011918 [Paraconiothyrium brasiliense]|uniref:Aminoglycoside phosphotransferase domain-containing protein n=1 Tax=Paraconiothyrium brasiliense TaxID=300254 RepID=A0ABR3QHB2_9PLEO
MPSVLQISPTKVVQFRTRQLDMLSIELARKSYAGFVPSCEAYDMLGTIHMYVWELVRGQAFCRVRHRFLAPGMEVYLTQTIQDFARFFASAWTNRQSVELPPSLCDEYVKTLDTLSRSLPQRFLPKLEEIRLSLPLLFRTEYPVVVQHDDLLENNIHVDEDTGRITGIVDWHDVMIAPFGVSLGSLEIVLGVQNGSTWHLHYDHVNLRKHFWDTLYRIIGEVSDVDRQCIEIARLFGLFRLYGPEENAAAYLDALCWL